jgi:poly-gamma-glutamate synthesis protein (capsule biosynthesis protein)
LALCNLETTFGNKPYAGYPLFSAPDELAPALKNAGFDVAVTANNHLMDRGLAGLRRTIDVLRGNGLIHVGSRGEPDAPQYVIVDVKDVKVAVLAYTYASSSASGGLLINGASVSKEAEALINYFRYDRLDEDLTRIGETAAEAKSAGADIVIVYYHWGEEYQLSSNARQRYIAERTVKDMDVDMIFASHPHTLQEIGFITNDRTGRDVPVFYSMGNFISNQRVETLTAPNVRYTEIGMIARVELEYDTESKELKYLSVKAVPTWVEKYKSGGKDIYAIIPLDGELTANETLAASGHLTRAQKALEDARGILGADFIM